MKNEHKPVDKPFDNSKLSVLISVQVYKPGGGNMNTNILTKIKRHVGKMATPDKHSLPDMNYLSQGNLKED